MQESFYRMICQIGTFMICAQAIVHFRPRESYGKYLKMLLSVMILVQIFQPFSNLFFGNTTQDFQAQIAYFQEEMEARMQAAVESARLSEEKLQEMSLMEVQERMAAQAEQAEQEEQAVQEELTEQAELAETENESRKQGNVKDEVSESELLEKGTLTEREDASGIEEVKIEVQWDSAKE